MTDPDERDEATFDPAQFEAILDELVAEYKADTRPWIVGWRRRCTSSDSRA